MFILPHLKGLTAGNLGSVVFKNAGLDLKFAANKSLVDSISGNSLVSFTRADIVANSATYVGSDGLIKTATTNEPRFDHNPTTGESLGLLVEEARTNFCLQSEDFSTTWGISNYTVTTNAATAPNGTATADKLIRNTTDTTTSVTQNVTVTANTAYNCSIFVKASEWSKVGLREGSVSGNYVTFDLSNGTIVSSSVATGAITAFSGGWYRISMQMTTGAAQTTYGVRLIPLPNSYTSGTPSYSFAGDGTSGIFLWGAQLEAGAFPTSYIPTTTATVTRAADVANITGSNFSSWYNHNEGTLRATASIRGGNTVVSSGFAIVNSIAKLAESAVTVNARAFVFNTTTSPNRYAFSQRSSLANVAVNEASYEAIQLGKYYTYGGSYVNNSTQGLALSVDGRTVVTNATAVDVPVPTRLLIGAGNSGSNAGVGIDEYYLNGTIKRLTYWPTRLANTTLQLITQA
jgi:hypothetical protein